MPARRSFAPALPALLEVQDWVLRRDQALSMGHSRGTIDHKLERGDWQALLPSVYLCHPGEPARRQRMIAGLLYAGDRSAIDGADACHYHGVKAVALDERQVHVAVPWGDPARSRGFVVIRRSAAPIKTVRSSRLRYVDPAAAVIAAARRISRERAVLALISDAVQRRIVTYEDLVAAHIQGPPRNAKLTDLALSAVGAGARSVPEADFLALVSASLILPQPLVNPVLILPDGQEVSPDALFADAGLVHETNGRSAHERHDLFEDLQRRHDGMTTWGLTVLHNPPRRLALHGRMAIAEVERCYLRLAGRGLPEGIIIKSMAA